MGLLHFLDNNETVRVLSNPKKNEIEITDNTLTRVPTNIPEIIGRKFFLSKLRFLYKGTARTIVAGPRKIFIKLTALIVSIKIYIKYF